MTARVLTPLSALKLPHVDVSDLHALSHPWRITKGAPVTGWLGCRTPVRSFAADAAQLGALAQRYGGAREIPVDAIVGSVGRSQELASDFMPIRRPGGDERYRRVLAAVQQDTYLPPIEVYQLGLRYYVLDGHHRVAAARATGQVDIDAVVTEFRAVTTQTRPAAA